MATTKLKFLSADNHIVEPPDLWTSKMERKYRDRAPYVVKRDKADWWYVEKHQPLGSMGNTTHPGDRYRTDSPHETPVEARWENVRRGAYDPHEAIKDMDTDGIQGAVVFPTLGASGMWRVEDAELFSAICRTYNDWVAEFCRPYPQRLKGMAMINLDNVQEGVEELRRAKSLGLCAGLITVSPPHERQYDRPEYESFWQAAQDLGIPLCLHSGSNRSVRDGLPMDPFAPLPHEPLAVSYTNNDYWIRRSMTSLILAGVFERFPRLKVVGVETNASWASYFLFKMDLLYRDRGTIWPHRFKDDLKPSDFFHRNMALSFQEDWVAVENRGLIGVENLLWGSDYPHTEGTWPESQRVVDEIFRGVPPEEVLKMTYLNTAKLFEFATG